MKISIGMLDGVFSMGMDWILKRSSHLRYGDKRYPTLIAFCSRRLRYVTYKPQKEQKNFRNWIITENTSIVLLPVIVTVTVTSI